MAAAMRRSAGVLVLSAALVAGCAGAGDSGPGAAAEVSNPYQEQRTAQIQPVLDQWARALRAGDADALRALTDDAAEPGFLERQLRTSEGLRGLDFSQWSLSVGEGSEVFVPQAIADRVGALDVAAPPVYLTFQLAGADEEPVRTPVGVVLARRGDTWTLVGDGEIADSAHATWPAGPWVYGPTDSLAVPMGDAGSGLVLFHPAAEAQAAMAAELLPGAVAAVAEFWGPDWDRSVVLEIAATDEEFSALTGNRMGRTDIAAASISLREDGAQDGHGQRIVFSPTAFDRLDELQRGIVLRHELTHIAVRRETGRGAPAWLVEGVPDYVAYRSVELPLRDAVPQVAAMVAANGPPDSLPEDSAFAGPMADLAYQLGRTVADFVAATMGEETLRELHRAVAVGGLAEDSLDEAVRGATGMNMNQFTTAWSRWLGAQFGS